MPDPNDYPRIIYRSDDVLLRKLERRIEEHLSVHGVAKRDVLRYYDLIEFAHENLPPFSEAEALVLCHVVGGSKITARGMAHLWQDVKGELEDQPREEVDVRSFVARLRALTPDQCMAIADAVDQYWRGSYYKDAQTSTRRLRKVGLVRDIDE